MEVIKGIDRSRQDVILAGKKRCRKLAMGKIEFSTEVRLRKAVRELWGRVLCYKRGGRISAQLIWRSLRKCKVSRPVFRMSEEAVEAEYKKAVKAWEDIKPKAPILRIEFLTHILAKSIAEQENKDQAKVARKLIQAENQ